MHDKTIAKNDKISNKHFFDMWMIFKTITTNLSTPKSPIKFTMVHFISGSRNDKRYVDILTNGGFKALFGDVNNKKIVNIYCLPTEP